MHLIISLVRSHVLDARWISNHSPGSCCTSRTAHACLRCAMNSKTNLTLALLKFTILRILTVWLRDMFQKITIDYSDTMVLFTLTHLICFLALIYQETPCPAFYNCPQHRPFSSRFFTPFCFKTIVSFPRCCRIYYSNRHVARIVCGLNSCFLCKS